MDEKINSWKDNSKAGHRERLRNRFLEDHTSLADYEILELLLTYTIPRRDVSDLAKYLLKKVNGDFNKLFTINFEDAFKEEFVNEKVNYKMTAAFFKLMREFKRREANSKIEEKKDRETPLEDIIERLRAEITGEGVEHFYILFFNNKRFLLGIEEISKGTPTGTAFYPSQVAKAALLKEASGVMIAHNHPSGDIQPSKADISTTSAIKQALQSVGIALFDHIIISENSYFSFYEENYI